MIELKKKNRVLLNSDNIKIVDIEVDDIKVNNHIEESSGLHGGTFYGVDYGTRKITLTFDKYINGLDDFNEQRRQMQKIFNQGECQLYLFDNAFINVTKNSEIDISRTGMVKMRCIAELITTGLPYFESVEYDVQTFTNLAKINYNNKSDITLDNRYTDTTITITLAEAVNFYQISAGDVTWRYKKALQLGDQIVLKDATVFKGSEDLLEDTTMNVLMLESGQNVMDILGSTKYTLEVKSKIYYY